MNIADVLQRNPAAEALVNNGQARIGDQSTEKEWTELRGELSTFVCEGQYADGIRRILESYLGGLNAASQKGAWVSGFYGSGKSHLLKMLCHLWRNTDIPGYGPARSLVPSLPAEIQSALVELDTHGRRGGGLMAAAGSLPSGTTDHVRLTVLGLLFRACGLPAKYEVGRFCLWLREEGHYAAMRAVVQREGREWDREIDNLYASPVLRRALLECDPHFAADEGGVRDTLRAQFPQPAGDISSNEMLDLSRRALKLHGKDGKVPCTVLILDEAQQYINDSADRATLVTEVAEAFSHQFDSRVMVVAAGQSALNAIPLLQKLLDRFTVRVPLSDTDVDTVTRRVVLQKKPAAKGDVRAILDTHAGEISRHLSGTRIASRTDDGDTAIDDYPLLPTRRRFWDHCFRAIDLAGAQSQLRSQLRILHDAVAKLADRPVGALIPGDELYTSLAPEMLQTGALPREISDKIVDLRKDGSDAGILRSRVCGLIFLIQSLPREAVADIGVRATKEHIADLLIDDLNGDNGKLRSAVGDALEWLVTESHLMKLDEEYRLQTREGAEWEADFRNRLGRLGRDEARVHELREKVLYAEWDKRRASVKIQQGASKVARTFNVSREATPPPSIGSGIPLWVRDGWATSQKEILAAARKAGPTNPTIFAFIPMVESADLQRAILEVAAAEDTLAARGVPSTEAGGHAKQSMQSRLAHATRQLEAIVARVVGATHIYEAGGSEQLAITVEQKLRDAAEVSLARLFPRFKDADSASWDRVIKLAKDGSDKPLSPVGHDGVIETHAVCQQVLATIGGGAVGTAIRRELEGAPCGWPQDAIDAALMCLHNGQHVSATLNGTPVSARQLDQNKIARAEFRVERVTLSASDKLKLRQLLQVLEITAKNEDLADRAREFVQKALTLAGDAGGEAPLPVRPSTVELEDMGKQSGTDLLSALLQRSESLKAQIAAWQAARKQILEREPTWRILQRLANHAAGLSDMAETIAQVGAIRDARLLLDAVDPVPPLRSTLSAALRSKLGVVAGDHATAYAVAIAQLDANVVWKAVGQSDRDRIIASVGLVAPVVADLTTDDDLLRALDAQTLTARESEVLAVAGRAHQALVAAAQAVEPTVRSHAVARATLRTPEDVRAWVSAQEVALLEAIKSGPVIIG